MLIRGTAYAIPPDLSAPKFLDHSHHPLSSSKRVIASKNVPDTFNFPPRRPFQARKAKLGLYYKIRSSSTAARYGGFGWIRIVRKEIS